MQYWGACGHREFSHLTYSIVFIIEFQAEPRHSSLRNVMSITIHSQLVAFINDLSAFFVVHGCLGISNLKLPVVRLNLALSLAYLFYAVKLGLVDCIVICSYSGVIPTKLGNDAFVTAPLLMTLFLFVMSVEDILAFSKNYLEDCSAWIFSYMSRRLFRG
jgi:hypothetical protein